ncbi:retrovirus-related pol polyprotein from transposon TNT 1-94 [Tanacetum coccineum]
MRSDNALEFVKGSIGPYLAELGIEHQTSYVDRPQQNGRGERKHRHLLEVARALRFHAHLPLKFWGDCVLTAAYMINRYPSLVLKFKTPYELLLNEVPTNDHLRVFGCLAMASNPSRTTDKFAERGVPYFVTPTLPSHNPVANSVSVAPLHSEFQCFLTILLAQSHSTPTNFKEALLDPEWCEAMNAELKSLEQNGTWELTTLPQGKKVIGSHWIYKIKLKADGSLERKKARLVVQGNRQRKGVDYKETFAPVAKMVTVRALLSVTTMKG